MTNKFHVRWNPEIGLGSIMNAVLLIGAAAAAWATMQYRMKSYEDRLDQYEKIFIQHAERIGKVEDLQVTLAELVIQQQHVMEETARIETRVENRLARIDNELDRLRMRIRELEVGRGD